MDMISKIKKPKGETFSDEMADDAEVRAAKEDYERSSKIEDKLGKYGKRKNKPGAVEASIKKAFS